MDKFKLCVIAFSLVALFGLFKGFEYIYEHDGIDPTPHKNTPRTQMGNWEGLGTYDIGIRNKVYKRVGELTKYGDIILVSEKNSGEYMFAWYADRRIEFFDTSIEDFKKQVKELDYYRTYEREKYKITGPIDLYALINLDTDKSIRDHMNSYYSWQKHKWYLLPFNWELIALDEISHHEI